MNEQTENLIANFMDKLKFNSLIKLAELLNINHEVETWFDDEWSDKENELRAETEQAFLAELK